MHLERDFSVLGKNKPASLCTGGSGARCTERGLHTLQSFITILPVRDVSTCSIYSVAVFQGDFLGCQHVAGHQPSKHRRGPV